MVMNGSHNHEAHNSIAHHQHRKFLTDIRKQVAFMTYTEITLKEIASSLSIEFPDQLWTMQDIYNLQHKLKSDQFGNCSPIEAMLYKLNNY